jgi:hypothetical protein
MDAVESGVLLVAILPTAVAVALATRSERWIGPPLILALFLAYGAAITSMGLAAATWIRSLPRVLAICVGAVVGMTVGSLPIVLVLFSNMGEATACIAMVSPFFGVGYYSDVIAETRRSNAWEVATSFAIFWTLFYGTVAIMLGLATLRTFDRALGRMPERLVVPPYVQMRWRPRRKPAMPILDEV